MATDEITIYQPSPEVWTRRCGGLAAGEAAPETLDRLVGAIYQGVMDTVPWQAALNQIKDALRAMHVALLLRPPSPQNGGVTIHADGFCAQATHSYETHFFALDPFLHLPPGEPTAPEDIDPRWSDHPMYRDYLLPLDVGPILGANLYGDDGVEMRLRVTRAHGAPAFSSRDRALCRLLLPHLRRAVQLHGRLEGLAGERQLLAGTIRRFALGMVTLGHDGHLRHANAEATRILDARDTLFADAGRLVGVDAQTGAALQRLIDAARSADVDRAALVAGMRLERPSGRASIGVVARTIPATEIADGPGRPALVLYLRDPEASCIPVVQEAVRRHFGLTRTEADLALCLTDGCTIDDAAERLGLSRDSVRTHLRCVLSKTGVTRQAALVQVLLNSMMSLDGDADAGLAGIA